MFGHQQVAEAYTRIRDHIHYTPVFTCSSIDEMAGTKVYFKAECMQKTGAFKARGALNAVSFTIFLKTHLAEKSFTLQVLKLKAERNVDHVVCWKF